MDWLEQGYAGTMHYLPERKDAYKHPDSVLSEARSLLVLGMHYGAGQEAGPTSGTGRVARYAWGSTDYHDLIHQRLRQLKVFNQQLKYLMDFPEPSSKWGLAVGCYFVGGEKVWFVCTR